MKVATRSNRSPERLKQAAAADSLLQFLRERIKQGGTPLRGYAEVCKALGYKSRAGMYAGQVCSRLLSRRAADGDLVLGAKTRRVDQLQRPARAQADAGRFGDEYSVIYVRPRRPSARATAKLFVCPVARFLSEPPSTLTVVANGGGIRTWTR